MLNRNLKLDSLEISDVVLYISQCDAIRVQHILCMVLPLMKHDGSSILLAILLVLAWSAVKKKLQSPQVRVKTLTIYKLTVKTNLRYAPTSKFNYFVFILLFSHLIISCLTIHERYPGI